MDAEKETTQSEDVTTATDPEETKTTDATASEDPKKEEPANAAEDTKAETKEDKEEGETKSEKEAETPQDDKVDVKKLLNDIKDKDKQVTALSEKVEEFNTLKTTHKETVDKLSSYEKVLNTIVESKLKEVPEDYKDLIPEGDLVKRLDWLNKADEKGLFGNKSEQPIGKRTKANSDDVKKEVGNLSPVQSMSAAFGEIFSKK